MAAAATNNTPARIQLFEKASQLQSDNADRWIPLKGKLLQAATQDQDPAAQQRLQELDRFTETTRANMKETALKLRDHDLSAQRTAAATQASTRPRSTATR